MDKAIKHDSGKPRFSLLPWDALREVVAVREYGVRTYGSEHCWQDVEPRRYVDALLRHGAEIVENGIHSRDAESGLLHTAHIACNALFLVWFSGRTKKPEPVEPKPAPLFTVVSGPWEVEAVRIHSGTYEGSWAIRGNGRYFASGSNTWTYDVGSATLFVTEEDAKGFIESRRNQ